MRKTRLLLIGLACWHIGWSGVWADEIVPQAQAPLTLKECYALALKRSETLAIQQELIQETEGRFLEALSTALPQASFVSTDKRQDGSGSSAFTLRHVPERRFTFSQPLFSGFKEFAAIAGSRAERRQRRDEYARAQQLLFVDVSDAFYRLVELQQDLKVLDAVLAALQERLTELKGREDLGRSRPSEVVSAEAQVKRIEAEQQRVRGETEITRHLLEFLTGRASIASVEDHLPEVPVLLSEDAYAAKADQRFDVRATHEAARVAAHETAVARAGFWPDMDVEGNYYTDRAGAAADVNWDVTLKVDVPLFQGGKVWGAVREAKSRQRQAELQWERTKRLAELDIRDAYSRLGTALSRRDALQQALAAAEDNYRLQSEEYRLNLVNNLDVLQTLQELENARRDFISAQYEAKRRYWALQAAIGQTL